MALSPRQKDYADSLCPLCLNGGGAGGSPWQVNGSSIYYNNGNVGIGTSTPSEKITVEQGGIKVTNPNLTGTPVAVYGEASNPWGGANSGGWFKATGPGGQGVYGEASHFANGGTGGYFVATGLPARVSMARPVT